jgi:hypothetical protein
MSDMDHDICGRRPQMLHGPGKSPAPTTSTADRWGCDAPVTEQTQVEPPRVTSGLPAGARNALRRLGPGDLAALRLWLLTRISAFLLVSSGAWLFAQDGEARTTVPYVSRWTQWDTVHYVTIAHWGYSGNPATGPEVPLEAFFPGFPVVMRLVHQLSGLGYVVSGLCISVIAGAIATVALARIAAHEAGGGPAGDILAERTVLLFLLAPSVIFLAAAYTEALFLAFALPAWLYARRRNWMAAGTLGCLAAVTRITGLFLGVALVVEFLCSRDGRRWREAPWLAGPFLGVFGYVLYLHQRTGDWMAWQHAEEKGWYRSFHWPWESLKITWQNAADHRQTTGFAWMFFAEITAVAIGIALTVWLIRQRRWAEAVYIGLQLYAFTTDIWFFSVPRATLLWWPLWTGLAAWTLRRRWVLQGWLTLFAPFSVVFTLLFVTGRWAG